MLLYVQTWLPLLMVTLTAAIFFGVASLMMAHPRTWRRQVHTPAVVRGGQRNKMRLHSLSRRWMEPEPVRQFVSKAARC